MRTSELDDGPGVKIPLDHLESTMFLTFKPRRTDPRVLTTRGSASGRVMMSHDPPPSDPRAISTHFRFWGLRPARSAAAAQTSCPKQTRKRRRDYPRRLAVASHT